jgi:pimeloyl-ACP methyl ester carboxylesterase
LPRGCVFKNVLTSIFPARIEAHKQRRLIEMMLTKPYSKTPRLAWGWFRGGLKMLPGLILLMASQVFSQSSAPWVDPSPHHASFVTVDKDIRLEVLDWGGSGKPLVLLAGAGNTAHVFDNFAPKLTGKYHVYGITRRGFGASAYSGSEFGADRLGDDVLAVIDSLKLKKPVLVGHSLAGEELSSIGSRYPNRIAGLVYLDAAYAYAFDNGKGTAMSEYQGKEPQPPAAGADDRASFDAYAKFVERVMGFAIPEAELRQTRNTSPDGHVTTPRFPRGAAGIAKGMKKYETIPVPALVIFAVPHSPGAWIKTNSDPAVQEAAKSFGELEMHLTERQAKAIEDAMPTARVVRIANAHHVIFLSNEADVLREMGAFFDGLGKNWK